MGGVGPEDGKTGGVWKVQQGTDDTQCAEGLATRFQEVAQHLHQMLPTTPV